MVKACVLTIWLAAVAFPGAMGLPGGAAFGQSVYPSIPDWESSDPRVSTGAALFDVDHDGWIDIVISDGNDIDPGPLSVYYNNGDGTFPTKASWKSTDYQYNGHLDVADVNGDGWLDVAVAHLGDFSTQAPVAKVYLNNEGTFSSLPDWEAGFIGQGFGCAFGDANGDGRPDLAVATGWSYGTQHEDHNLVYMNVGGTLEASASWVSDDTYDHQGALWADADDDGWLDLIMIASAAETRVYRNLGGVLETSASWTTSDSYDQDGIMVAVGDVNGDGVRELFATDNTQLGGSGRFKQYTGLADGLFETTYSWSYYEGYGSAVALADVNADGLLDLATGGWWENTRLFYNTGSGLPASPSWSSTLSTVNEKIVFADVDPACGVELLKYAHFDATRGQKLFYLPHMQVQKLVAIYRDNVAVPPDEFTWHREHGWIALNGAPESSLDVAYTYSHSLDMVVSNWDGDEGNFLYYNQQFDDCNDNGIPDGCDIYDGTSDDVNGNGVPDECECPPDVNVDGVVDVLDLLAVLSSWGKHAVIEDVHYDGVVDVLDLLEVLGGWGPC